jgi:hypothetical protein
VMKHFCVGEDFCVCEKQMPPNGGICFEAYECVDLA